MSNKFNLFINNRIPKVITSLILNLFICFFKILFLNKVFLLILIILSSYSCSLHLVDKQQKSNQQQIKINLQTETSLDKGFLILLKKELDFHFVVTKKASIKLQIINFSLSNQIKLNTQYFYAQSHIRILKTNKIITEWLPSIILNKNISEEVIQYRRNNESYMQEIKQKLVLKIVNSLLDAFVLPE